MNPGRRLDILRLRLRTFFRRNRVERELDKELSLPPREPDRRKPRPGNVAA